MAGRLCDILPTAADLMRLKPEELAGPILETLHFQAALSSSGLVQGLEGYIGSLFSLRAEQYPIECQREVERAVTEAWCWLRHQGFVAPDMQSRGYDFITRRGLCYRTREQLASYRKAQALPWELIRRSIRDKVWGTFLRGDHDTAVFQAFKEVEVAVPRSLLPPRSLKQGVLPSSPSPASLISRLRTLFRYEEEPRQSTGGC